MRLVSASCFAALAAAVPQTANAWWYLGNPAVMIQVQRPASDLTTGSVVLTKVEVVECDTDVVTYTVNQTIDPVAGYDLTINGGDLCKIRPVWGSILDMEHPSWTAEYDKASTTVNLTGDLWQYTVLSPITITSGEFSGLNPRLYVSIE